MAKQKIDFSAMGALAAETGHQLAAQDRAQERAVAATRTELPLDQVSARPAGDTRPVDVLHVLSLAESIAAIGLLEPLVVDRKNRLIAGAHRLAALRLLAADDRKSTLALPATATPALAAEVTARVGELPADSHLWRSVPVHRLDFDAEVDQATALAAEVAENERRRDYTREEIKTLAERLKNSGFKHSRGRPRAGEKSLIPALEVIVGKSKATLWRMLSETKEAPKLASVIVSDETITAELTKLVARMRKTADTIPDGEPSGKARAILRQCADEVARLLGLNGNAVK